MKTLQPGPFTLMLLVLAFSAEVRSANGMIPASNHNKHDSPRSDGKMTVPKNNNYTFINTNTQALDKSTGRQKADIDELGQKPFYAQLPRSRAILPYSKWLEMWKASQEGCGVPGIKVALRQPRIAGGRPSETGNWPWMVSLSPKPMKGQHMCGGTLIASNWVLTAAHCLFAMPFFYGENKWLMRLGKLLQSGPLKEETEQDFNVSLIVVHPLYDFRVLMPTEVLGKPSDHDLALVKLSGDVTITPWVRPICLPPPQFKPRPGKLCVITGWGLIYDPTSNTSSGRDIRARFLQEAMLPIWEYSECKSLDGYKELLTPNMLCAGFKEGIVDTCSMDSGGPLQCKYNDKWSLIGVTSWGDAGGQGCARPMKPGVYSDVGVHVPWIFETMYSDYAGIQSPSWHTLVMRSLSQPK